jgi:hypothetical protein
MVILCISSVLAYSQKILVVENAKSTKNFKYYQGDDIIIKFGTLKGKVTDQIVDMTDSSIVLLIYGEVYLDDISTIYKGNWFVRILQGLTLVGGVAYFGIDSFNRLINNDSPVVLQETAIISGAMVAFSFALTPLRYRWLKVGERWKLRIIDFEGI